MAYLEELLPEFRKGAKIRLSTWPKTQYIYKKGKEIYNEDGEISKFLDGYVMTCSLWEFYQEPIDWEYIIKNKCLCWFWDHSEERKRTGLLARLISQDEYRFEKRGYNGEPSMPYMNCRPVRRDEVNFYKDKRDGNN